MRGQDIPDARILYTAVIVTVMGLGGVFHLARPEVFYGLVFAPLPPYEVVVLSGLAELAIAAAALLPRTRPFAGLAFSVLCTIYLPLHLWDLVRADPVIGPLWARILRVPLQGAFIWIGWRLWSRRARP